MCDGLAASLPDKAPPEHLALLPDDAPPGHEAHKKVHYSTTVERPLARFKIVQKDGTKTCFQTTLGQSRSREACEILARVCYMKFEAGATKEEVLQFRNGLYEQLGGKA